MSERVEEPLLEYADPRVATDNNMMLPFEVRPASRSRQRAAECAELQPCHTWQTLLLAQVDDALLLRVRQCIGGFISP